MQSLDDLSDFGKRVRAIRLEWKAIARQAGVATSTVLRMGRGRHDGHVTTFHKVHRVLEAEEIATALHLIDLPHVKQALADRAAAQSSEAA